MVDTEMEGGGGCGWGRVWGKEKGLGQYRNTVLRDPKSNVSGSDFPPSAHLLLHQFSEGLEICGDGFIADVEDRVGKGAGGEPEVHRGIFFVRFRHDRRE